MKRLLLSLALFASAPPALAQDLPEGLSSARFLPGWTAADGSRIAALELVLAPGWKTYWRSPGDAGLPPEFEWQGSNMGAVAFHWPAPEVIESGGMRTLGYHDRLVLPFTVAPEDGARPVGISAKILLGLCEDICVPASLDLVAPPPGADPDPVIEAAMAQVPVQGKTQPLCAIGEIEDGMTVTLSLPLPAEDLAVEYAGEGNIWASAPRLNADGSEVTVDFVAPSGKPFPLDPARVVTTLLGEDEAVEFLGCSAG